MFDELDLQRATQAYLDFYPALSLLAMLKGQVANYGVRSCSDIIVFADKMDSTPLWLTGNTDSIYALVTLDLKEDGPTVIEIPPGVLGTDRSRQGVVHAVPVLRTPGALLRQDLDPRRHRRADRLTETYEMRQCNA